jgi:hypothetical protein
MIVLVNVNPPSQWLNGIGFVAALSLMFLVLVHLLRQQQKLCRELGLLCPNCNKPLLELNAKLALTTGRCAECGSLLISDP